jgi:hypothetical protein
MRKNLPCVDWSDDKIINFAERYYLPIVQIRLYDATGNDTCNIAKIDFRIRPAKIERYSSEALK